MKHAFTWLAFLCVLAAEGHAMRPQDAGKRLEELFGSEIRRVSATRDPDDDVKLARVLLDHVTKGSQEAAMVAAVCQAVYDLGANAPGGQELAIEAMRLWAQRVPERTADATEKIVAIRRRQYAQAKGEARSAAGDVLIEDLLDAAKRHADSAKYADALRLLRQAAAVASSVRSTRKNQILAEIRRVSALERTQQQVAMLRARLKSHPEDDAAAGRLVELYLVGLDRPAAAAEFLRSSADERLRTYVPLAAKDPAALPKQACLELGNWYHGLSQEAPAASKPAMLQRAKTYLQRYLEIREGSDLASAKVKLTLERIEAELERLAPPEPAGPWMDVLRLVDPAKHAVSGRWRRTGSHVGVRAEGVDRILIPAAPKGDYELKLQFVRRDGSSEVNLILPVGETSVVLMLSRHGGRASGLSCVGGKYCDDNETRAAGQIGNNVTHTVEVKVKTKAQEACVSATLDGKKLVEWKGPQSALACASGWSLPDKGALGLGAYQGSTTAFTGAQLRMLSGRAARVAYARPTERDEDRRPDPRRTGRRTGRDWRGGRRGGPRR